MKKEKTITKEELNDKLSKGWILAKVIFEIVGNPKSHVITTLNGIVNEIKSEEHIIIINQEIAEPEEKNNLWSSFADCEILVYGLDKFIWLAMNFTPANIEIIKPEEFMITEKNMTDWLNEILSMMHTVNNSYRIKHQEDMDIKRNFNILLRNAILLGVDKGLTQEEIGKAIGMPGDQLTIFLNAMLKEKSLRKVGDTYERVTVGDFTGQHNIK
jgi:hypothetical protein